MAKVNQNQFDEIRRFLEASKTTAPPARTRTPSASQRRANRYYFAYGSNLNRRQMHQRCPDAQALHTYKLYGYELCFRGVADIRKTSRNGAFVDGAVYCISARDEKLLDVYEGYRADGTGKYRKEYLDGKTESGKAIRILCYQMNDFDEYPPTDTYLGKIEQGYVDWGLSLEGLDRPLLSAEAAWDAITSMRTKTKTVPALVNGAIVWYQDNFKYLPDVPKPLKLSDEPKVTHE